MTETVLSDGSLAGFLSLELTAHHDEKGCLPDEDPQEDEPSPEGLVRATRLHRARRLYAARNALTPRWRSGSVSFLCFEGRKRVRARRFARWRRLPILERAGCHLGEQRGTDMLDEICWALWRR